MSGGGDGLRRATLSSWRLDGSAGPLRVRGAHSNGDAITALAVTADDAGPLNVSGDVNGALRSWRLDGSAGPLQQRDAHDSQIQAVAVAADAAGPLIVSGGRDGALKSWRLDGSAGPLQERGEPARWIMALAVTADAAGRLIVSGDGTLRHRVRCEDANDEASGHRPESHAESIARR